MSSWRDPSDEELELLSRYVDRSGEELDADLETEWAMLKRELIAIALVVLVVVARLLWLL